MTYFDEQDNQNDHQIAEKDENFKALASFFDSSKVYAVNDSYTFKFITNNLISKSYINTYLYTCMRQEYARKFKWQMLIEPIIIFLTVYRIEYTYIYLSPNTFNHT